MQTNTPGSLKEKFGHFGAAPTEQLWDSISSSLDQKEKKRRGIFWWWFAGVAASGLLLFGIYYLGYQVGKNENNIAEENSNAVEISNANSSKSNDEVEMKVDANGELNNDGNVQSTASHAVIGNTDNAVSDFEKNSTTKSDESQNNRDNHLDGMTSSTEDDIEIPSDDHLNETRHALETADPIKDNSIVNSTEKMTRLDYPQIHKIELPHVDNFNAPFLAESVNDFGNNKWEIGFSIETLTSLSPDEEPLYFDAGNGFTADFSSLENTIQGTGILSSQSPSSGTISRPLSIDFSIARTFGKRWSLQSGLGVNWVKSTTFYDYLSPSQVNASFFSLSVPLVAEFDFVKRKRFEFSAGLGIVNEIPLYLRSASIYPVLEFKTVSKSFISGYMSSGLLNLGVSYRITEKMKIGLHPNLRHYFFQSMKSDFPVVEKKTWVGANIGLVWEI